MSDLTKTTACAAADRASGAASGDRVDAKCIVAVDMRQF
jgi:hypothetical protein